MKNKELTKTLKEFFNKILDEFPDISYKVIEKEFNSITEELMETYKLKIGIPDEQLSEKYLEFRVHMLFKEMGSNLILDQTGVNHDGIIQFNSGKTEFKLVLEIKSHKNGVAATEDLRELDDWVFQLSGEEKARKQKVPVGTYGWVMGQPHAGPGYFEHPDPHKGVFVLNHDCSQPFGERRPPFGHNEIEFAKTRNFCLIDFQTLLMLYEKVRHREYPIEKVLMAIYKSVGVFRFDDE
jgi:hypothetical protein